MTKPGLKGPSSAQDQPVTPRPVDVVDGIPDRAPRSRPWVHVVLVCVFLCWLGFLIYCAVAGGPKCPR